MSEFNTIADLFSPDRQPTRELEPIQKVDRTDRLERDIEEFYETDSAERVLEETAKIVAGRGLNNRFRYIEATFGSGKSHLLKLIGVATGEMKGLEQYAYQLANSKSGFKKFRDALSGSHIDHLQPLFMNLLDRDRDETTLPMIIFEEFGRRRGYYTSRTWLLEFCWRLDIEYGLWEQLEQIEYEGLQLSDVVDRPSSLRPWLTQAIPRLDESEAAGLGTEAAVETEIDEASATVGEGAFGPYDLVDRLDRTQRYLEQDGDVYEFLIGLDEIAIYVGDQPRRYEEVVETIEALIDGLNPPILGTGQWSMRNMQQNFVGDVDEGAWYTQKILLEGADTETIVRKRWLQKSESGKDYIETELLSDASTIEPDLVDDVEPSRHHDPVEAYPLRNHDLWLLRETMQGLIEGDRETDREYIQGRALLVRVRSLFADHGWAERDPGAVVPWDVFYDILESDTALLPGWARDLISRVENTLSDPLAVRTAKALFLLSQTETVPRTATNLARLLADDVESDIDALQDEVEAQLKLLAEKNLIREDVDASPTTYTILSEEDIQFWQEVQKEATEAPEHQVKSNILQFLQDADPDRLTAGDSTATRTFGDVSNISYTARYSIDTSIPDSAPDRYDAIVVRLLADGRDNLDSEREHWQNKNNDPSGREDVLVAVELTEAIRQQIRQLIGMQAVLSGMADPEPGYRLQRQDLQEEIEDTLQDRLHEAAVYTPTRGTAYGSYLESFDEVMAEAVNGKFPNRKVIERSIQLDDLQQLEAFFEDNGDWPFTDDDADLLGVNTVPGTISDGWVTEFLAVFDGEDRVSGEQVIETVEGRQGEFLGTPLDALQALLFVLVADNRIEIRSDGERVTDTDKIARIITSRTGLEDAIVGFDPAPPPEDLDDVYEALLGEAPDTDDTKVLLEEIGEWVETNGSTIRTVVSRTSLEFKTKFTLDKLETALNPAFSGNELDADLLTNSTVVDQANLYRKVAPLFTKTEDEDEPIWDRFEKVYDTLTELYPTATIVKQMQVYASGSQVPERDTLESKIGEATAFRVEQLQTVYRHLSGTATVTDEIESLREELTAVLTEDTLTTEIQRIEESYEKVTLDELWSLIDQAKTTTDPLPEIVLADHDIREEAETLAHGRALLETPEDGESLFDQLVAVEESLTGEHSGFTVDEIRRAISGSKLPDADRARQLISQGEHLLDSDDTDDQTDLEQLWTKIAEHDDGTIVVIDTEGTR